MPHVRSVLRALGLLALGIAALTSAGDAYPAPGSLNDELRAKYPRAPKKLEEDPQSASIVIVDTEFHGIIRLNGLDGAALESADDGELIRSRPMKGRMVLFQPTKPGTYSLRYLRVSNYNAIIVLERPPGVELNVTAEKGTLAYLGKVIVTQKGGSAPTMELAYDVGAEAEAWTSFRKKYSNSPWIPLVEQRIADLEAGEAAKTH